MKKIGSVVLVTVPVSLGAFAIACWDYSADDALGGIPGTGETPVSGGSTPTPSTGTPNTGGATVEPGTLPCDVLEGAALPCVSAHSTVRVVVRGYDGPLYQVQTSNGMTLDIGSVDGYADAVAQNAFCGSGGCVIKIIYDQSPMGNDLTEAPPGSAKPTPGNPVNASALPVTINGRSVYGILIRPGMGYRDVTPNGTAVGDEPQTMYMVSSQHDLINGCCFDYGNAETTANNDGNGTMEAVYLGMGVIWGTGVEGGPWVMADLENGLYPGWERGQDRNISTNTPLRYDFVTAVVVGDTADKNGGRGRFALYGGDATAGALKEMYDGIRPEKPGYVPMQKQGSIILGIGGDNSNGGAGRFYEGVVANGVATRETVDELQAAIVAAGYGR
jgi:non-reducing end alpha-L-arabinofuranosidase